LAFLAGSSSIAEMWCIGKLSAGRAAACTLTVALAAAAAAPTAGAVVGGQPVQPGQFEYVANVFIGGDEACTGVLLAPDWVMTAGHCGSVTGSGSEGLAPTRVAWPAAAYTVQLGTPYANGKGGETHSVSEVIVDSDYWVWNGVGNDVSLLKLTTPTQIKPLLIAPPADASIWRPGALATIAGFGTTSESASTPPSQMRWARVPFTSDAYCASKYPFGGDVVQNDGWFDPATMICAGYPQGGTDTCEGDSGGPLAAPAPGSDGRQLLLVGATSFGDGCAQAGHPGVYAFVAEGPIRSFIQSVVPQAFAPPPPPAHRTSPTTTKIKTKTKTKTTKRHKRKPPRRHRRGEKRSRKR
jgi:secreted trypsin-like serine protease